MDQKRIVELWSRLSVGEKLAPAEEQELLDCLSSQPALRDDILADESIDSLLQCLGRIDRADDRFVGRVLQRTSEDVRPEKEPEVRDRPLTIRADATRGSRRKRGERIWQAATLAACCIAAVIIVILVRLSPTPDKHSGGSVPIVKQKETPRKSQPVGPEIKPKVMPELPVREPVGLATLVHSNDAQWKSPPRKDGRLLAGELELLAGQAELHFDNGPVVRLSGPVVVDLRRGDEVYLKQGILTANVPQQAIGFTVLTPTSRVVDLGTEFQVDVAKSGASDTSVLKGRVSVEPQHDGKSAGKPVSLVAGEFDRATTWRPEVQAPTLPIFVSVSGPKQRFLGTINCNGSTAEFHSMQTFKSFETRTIKRLKTSPGSFGADWVELTRSFGTVGGGGSSIEINGKRMKIEKLEDAVKAWEEMMRHSGAMPPMPDASKGSAKNTQSTFHGFVIINGKRIECHSQAEFEAAQKKMLGGWGDR